MKKLLLALAVAVPGFAHADIIKCNFTEPFYQTTYSMTQNSLTISHMGNVTQVITGVSFQIMGRGRFELWDRNRNLLQRFALNNAGSDGMSDKVYPYQVYWTQKAQYGGCTSNFLHAQ